ncbi:MAG TPA: MoaD/ThiS family protein [Candidatus Binataceae bacterium]|nr:MoaD/ThiS family protein [Candidatus Binataceae bacterium]
MRVLIPSPLRSYTHGATEVEAAGATLDAVTRDLDHRFPGIRFRMIDEHDHIRRHIRIFVNREQTPDLRHPVSSRDEVQIICALTGG